MNCYQAIGYIPVSLDFEFGESLIVYVSEERRMQMLGVTGSMMVDLTGYRPLPHEIHGDYSKKYCEDTSPGSGKATDQSS